MYENYYRLHARPFQLCPDPGFFFNSAKHKRAMSYLRFGLAQGEGFVVITGEIGAGKTTLIKALTQYLDPQAIITVNLMATRIGAHDTLRLIAAGFGLSMAGSDKATLLKCLETLMTGLKREGKQLLLLVDEAQNLPTQSLEELRLLSNYQLGARGLLQVVLVGQPEFRRALQAGGLEQLRQRVVASYHLGPLNAPQTRDYIEHRLHCAGWGGDPRFSDDAHALIHSYTNGIPRRINIFCDRLLLFGMVESLHDFSAGTVNTVVQEMKSELFDNACVAQGNDGEERRGESAVAGQQPEKCVVLRPAANVASDPAQPRIVSSESQIAKRQSHGTY